MTKDTVILLATFAGWLSSSMILLFICSCFALITVILCGKKKKTSTVESPVTLTPVSSLSQEPEPTPSRLPPILQQQQSAPTPIDSIRLKKNRDSTLTMGGMTADSACNTLAMSPCNHPTKMTVADCEKCRLHELSERRRREEKQRKREEKKKRKKKKKKKKQEKMKKDKVEEEEKAKQDGKEKAEEKPSPDRKAANDEGMKTAAPLPVSTDGSKRKLPDYSKSREGFKASRKDFKASLLEFNKMRDDMVMPETGEKKTTEQMEQTERTEEPKKEEEKKYEGIDGIEPEQQKKTTEDVMVLVKTKSVNQTGGISEGCI